MLMNLMITMNEKGICRLPEVLHGKELILKRVVDQSWKDIGTVIIPEDAVIVKFGETIEAKGYMRKWYREQEAYFSIPSEILRDKKCWVSINCDLTDDEIEKVQKFQDMFIYVR